MPGNGKSKGKAQTTSAVEFFPSGFGRGWGLWGAAPTGQQLLASKAIALGKSHFLLVSRGSAPWAGREIRCAANGLPSPPPAGFWGSPRWPSDLATLWPFSHITHKNLAFPLRLNPPSLLRPFRGSVRHAPGGWSRVRWRPGGAWWGAGAACLPLLLARSL